MRKCFLLAVTAILICGSIGFAVESHAASGDISFSLLWGGRNDLDLVVTTPGGYIVSRKTRQSPDGGILDLESNRGGVSNRQPIENIYWPEGKAPRGGYCVYIDYVEQYGSEKATPYVLLIRRSGMEPEQIKGVAHPRDQLKLVARVRY